MLKNDMSAINSWLGLVHLANFSREGLTTNMLDILKNVIHLRGRLKIFESHS